MAACLSSADSLPDAWGEWRRGVVKVLRREFSGVLGAVNENDVDWDAWRPLFDQGRSPEAAVDHAFLRDPGVTPFDQPA